MTNVIDFDEYRQRRADAKINAMLDDLEPEEKFSMVATLDRILIEARNLDQAKTWAFEVLLAWGHVVVRDDEEEPT